MKALLLAKPGNLHAIEADEPGKPDAESALVRVVRVGVCGTDIHAYAGRQPFFTYPRIPGHELGVEILEIGPNERGLKPGDHCAVEPYLNCGQCVACRRGRPNCCTHLSVLGVHQDGGMRERLLVPWRKLHPSPRLNFDQLALIETLVIGRHAVRRAALESGESVLVVGAGPIGLAVVQFARAAGARVLVADTNPRRLEFCRTHWGVEHTLNPAEGDAVETLRELASGDPPTAVFDATGNAQSMQAAFNFPAHSGRLVFVGLFQGDVSFNDPNFHRRELTLLASRNGDAADFREVIELIESGGLDTRAWITHRAPLAAVPAEFPAWTRPESGVLKAIIEVS